MGSEIPFINPTVKILTMKKIPIALLLIGIILACGCTTEPEPYLETTTTTTYTISQEEKHLITNSEAQELRISTFNNCQYLLNQTVNFKGIVLYEECGKNCLGGCPNTGPEYCYYGIKDENDCIVYQKSRITAIFENPEQIFNKYDFGQEVEVKDEITIYYEPYCNFFVEGQGYVNEVPECSYFIIGSLW